MDGSTDKRYRWYCMDNELEQGTSPCNSQQCLIVCYAMFRHPCLPIMYIIVIVRAAWAIISGTTDCRTYRATPKLSWTWYRQLILRSHQTMR